MILMRKAFKNIVVKRNNAGNLHFLPFQQHLPTIQARILSFWTTLKLSFADYFNLDQSKMLWFAELSNVIVSFDPTLKGFLDFIAKKPSLAEDKSKSVALQDLAQIGHWFKSLALPISFQGLKIFIAKGFAPDCCSLFRKWFMVGCIGV